ncbi:hypothetical protein D9758_011123 [Tetrapyrgos nigripes]|uniref:Uncharacterized protein n=1 Tax=Tetrapyrgos nigripes TaxID=182062 RepID=A0A8H5FNN4_9AGAR|nr:hypothetical protein D9758_011123 [Tetrapyrgos nigripes]
MASRKVLQFLFFPRNASNSTSATPSASIPPINPPERPRRHTAHRPASPIVFAPERPSGSGRGGIDSDDDLEGDGHYYDEHGIYGAGDPDTAAKAGNAKDTSEGKSFTGVSSISYVSQISGLSYASTASKYSQRSGYSHSSHLSQVSEASSQTRSPVSTEDTHGLPMIDTAFGQEKNKTDTIRPRSKRGPRGPRRPVSPMTFAPMGKTPTSGQATKGGFGEYETYSTYSPDDSAPNFALPLVGATTSQATNEKDGDIASIESNSTLPAYSGKFSRGDGLENNNNNSSDEEGTQFTMGYEEDGEDAYDEDDEYEEEPGHGKEKEEDYDDNQPPPGTGRVGPAPIVPNRPGTSHSTASSPSNHPSTTSLAMGNLFSSRKEKDSKDKGKDKEKRKEKKKDKDKQKEKHRSKLEKADRGDRTRDWVEVERSREKERELFTSSISAMSGISTKPRKDTRERDRDRERERRDRKVYGPLQKRADHTPSYETYHPMLVTVMRFSTGQILEDHFALGWYELKPYELLEIHRRGVILTLPRTLTVDYISPYWEGYVRALRVVLRGPNNLAVSVLLRGLAVLEEKTFEKSKRTGGGSRWRGIVASEREVRTTETLGVKVVLTNAKKVAP